MEKIGGGKTFGGGGEITCLREKGDLHRSDRCFAETDIDCLFN